MTANRNYLTWPTTWILRVLTSCFLVAGMALGGLWLNEASAEHDVASIYSETIECEDCQFDIETASEATEEPVKMGPGFTVSWANDGFRYCMRSGIARYGLPPE